MRERIRCRLAGHPSHVGRLFQQPGMLHRAKYSRFRNDSLSSLEEPSTNAVLRGKSPSSPLAPGSSADGLPPEAEDIASGLSAFLPKMAHLKLSHSAAGLLGLKSFPRGTRETPRRKVTNSLRTRGLSSPSALDLTRCLSAPSQPEPQKVPAGTMQPASGEWVSSVHPAERPVKAPAQTRDDDLNSGTLYTVRYMGCVEVLQSMRTLDFSTRTQVTREAISRVCEAVPSTKAAMRKRRPPSKELSTVLGKSNLQFAGMQTVMSISTSSLSLMIPDSKQLIAKHHMQSVSFASGGDPDTSNYVAYVAKDPVNQRACHILECFDDLAQCVINSIGQAFELRFKQYLKNPQAAIKPNDESRTVGLALWKVANEDPNHEYCNEIPGKLASPARLQNARVNEDSVIQTNSNQMIKDGNISQTANPSPVIIYENYSNPHKETFTVPGKAISPSDLFDDPSYMNTQNPHASTMMGVSGQVSANIHRDGCIRIAQNSAAAKSSNVVPMPVTHSSMREQLMKEIWYCGRMSRQEAERLLINDGDFLVRESMTTPGQYVLTGLQGGQAKHLLLVDPEGMVRTKDRLFDSVSHLISYHVDNQLPIISSGNELYLKKNV